MVPVAVMLRDLVKRGLIQEVEKGKWMRTQTAPPTPRDTKGLRVPFKKHGKANTQKSGLLIGKPIMYWTEKDIYKTVNVDIYK